MMINMSRKKASAASVAQKLNGQFCKIFKYYNLSPKCFKIKLLLLQKLILNQPHSLAFRQFVWNNIAQYLLES